MTKLTITINIDDENDWPIPSDAEMAEHRERTKLRDDDDELREQPSWVDAEPQIVEPFVENPNMVPDEFGRDARYDDWLWGCSLNRLSGECSRGDRVMSAVALEIAADVMHAWLDRGWTYIAGWSENDVKLALAAIAGIRAQTDCEHGFLTTDMDVAIYG